MSTHPEVLWAQRSNANIKEKNLVYLTVRIPDAKNYKIQLESDRLKIESDSDDFKDHYKVDLEFFDAIDTEHSHYNIHGNQIKFLIRKAKPQTDYWPRLIKEKLKVHFIKTDFDKWVDEDEQDEAAEKEDEGVENNGNFDIANLLAQQGGAGGMPGMPGMPGMSGMPGMPGMGGPSGLGGPPQGFDPSKMPDFPDDDEYSSSGHEDEAETSNDKEKDPKDPKEEKEDKEEK